MIPRLSIGIDPAMLTSGVAFRWHTLDHTSPVITHIVQGIENLNPAIRCIEAARLAAGPKCWVTLVIEYPTWSGHGAEQIRAAANCWIRALKAAFPRKLKVRKVTPQTWLAREVPGWRKAVRPADLYIPRALWLTGRESITEDEAAAVCLLHLGDQLIGADQWDIELRVTKLKATPRKVAA